DEIAIVAFAEFLAERSVGAKFDQRHHIGLVRLKRAVPDADQGWLCDGRHCQAARNDGSQEQRGLLAHTGVALCAQIPCPATDLVSSRMRPATPSMKGLIALAWR